MIMFGVTIVNVITNNLVSGDSRLGDSGYLVTMRLTFSLTSTSLGTARDVQNGIILHNGSKVDLHDVNDLHQLKLQHGNQTSLENAQFFTSISKKVFNRPRCRPNPDSVHINQSPYNEVSRSMCVTMVRSITTGWLLLVMKTTWTAMKSSSIPWII